MRFSFLTIVALLALSVSAAADECQMTTSDPEVDTGETPAGRYYVDNDDCVQLPERPTDLLPGGGYGGDDGCIFSVWIYQESNGVDGLQRIDEVKDDSCGGEYEGDSLAFF